MKKMIMLATMLIMVAVTSTVFAKTFSDGGVKISAEAGNGKIHVQGNASDIDKYVKNIQFCPDQIKYQDGFTCGLNWPISAERVSANEVVFHLDMNAVQNGQRAFNFKNNGAWSQVLSSKTAGNVVIEMSDPSDGSDDGRGGCHYTYVGDLPAGSYIPYKPELCGGGNAGGKYAASAKPATASNMATDQAAIAVATNQSAAAAHNSAAATNQSAAANNSSVANATSFLNINQVNNSKGKKGGKSNNTAIIYAPNASQKVDNRSFRGNSVDLKIYNSNKGKDGKGKGGGIKNVITYVGPSYQTIHFGVTGAESYDVYACTKCHSPSAKDDERARKMVLTQMSSALAEDCKHASTDKCTDKHKKGRK
jgi:hypothetical protein